MPQDTATAPAPEFGIRPRPRAWSALLDSAQITSDNALADVIGLNRSTVGRVMRGEVEPSTKFVAHALHAFPFASFGSLFELYRKAA